MPIGHSADDHLLCLVMQGETRKDQSYSVSQETFQILPHYFHTDLGGPLSQYPKDKCAASQGSRGSGREDHADP